MFEASDITLILKALHFAAIKHRTQHRRDGETPYINHPIEVAEVLGTEGNVRDAELLAAALLHDTLEDTETTAEEIQTLFGAQILAWVEEVSDDKTLSKHERKRLQIVHSQASSVGAKQIKISDKICNVRDLTQRPPLDWSLERKVQYLQWCDAVMVGLRGCNPLLDSFYDTIRAQARRQI